MILKQLYEVPKETGMPDATLHGQSALRLQYYRDGKPMRSGIRFRGVGAVLIRYSHFEPLSRDQDWYTLAEIEDSAWLKELLKDVAPQYAPPLRQKHHYAFPTKDDGLFEFIADSWELIAEEPGSWQD